MIIRRATVDDAGAIAAIHVHAWRVAYRNILPSAFLETLSVEARERGWRRNLERRDAETWVADGGGELVGWVNAGRSRDSDTLPTTAEVWAIYVAPPHWRQGVGRCLWQEAEKQLSGAGFDAVNLWVLKQNAQAIAFYEARGLAVESWVERTVTLGGAELVEIRLQKRLGGQSPNRADAPEYP